MNVLRWAFLPGPGGWGTAITVNIISPSMQMTGQVAIPSTTIIELSSKPPYSPQFSAWIPHSYIFHQIFISSGGKLFPAFIYSANLNAVDDLADTEHDLQTCFSRRKPHADERTVQGRSRHSNFKCERMTAHLLFKTQLCLSVTAWHASQLCFGHRASMTPEGNRFTSCRCGGWV